MDIRSIESGSSSIGSNAFAGVALLAISLLVLLILRHYLPLRTTPAYLLVPIFLALALPASIILLIPIDLASSSDEVRGKARGIWLPQRVMLVAWRITYWLCFVLTWVILPLLGEFTDSGERATQARMLYSLRSNGRYQLVVLCTCAVGLLYFSLHSGVTVTDIKPLIMALAYVWGLLLAISLMGHGLVAIPRNLYRSASVARTLRAIQSAAPGVHDKLEDAMQEMEEIEAEVAQLQRQKSSATPRDLQDWIDELSDSSLSCSSRLAPVLPPVAPYAARLPTVPTSAYLATLTRRLTRARHKRTRFVDAWSRLVVSYATQQAILDSSVSKSLTFPSSPSPYSPSSFLTPYTRYVLNVHILPGLRLLSSLLLALVSLSIVYSELIKPISPRHSIISLLVLSSPTTKNISITTSGRPQHITPFGQLIATVYLLYMCLAALSSLPTLTIWGNRALVRRHTYPESACWYASQTAKLAIPLAYNFLTFLPRDLHTDTTYYSLLGRLIDLTPLGRGFDRWFPTLVLLPVCFTLFGLYKRTRHLLGLSGVISSSTHRDDQESSPSSLPPGYGTGDWQEGRMLLDRELGGSSRLTPSSSSAALLHPTPATIPRSNRSSYVRDPPIRRARAGNSRPARRPPTTASATINNININNTNNNTNNTNNTNTNTNTNNNDNDNNDEEEDEDPANESSLHAFTHRLRNTFETTIAPPAFLRRQGRSTPRWMRGADGNNNNDDNNNNTGGVENDNPTNGVLGRLFGGVVGRSVGGNRMGGNRGVGNRGVGRVRLL